MCSDPELITRMFNRLITHWIFPPMWKDAKFVRIPKPGKTSIENPKNLRSISLQSCLGKLWEKIQIKRIAEAGTRTLAISKEHMGSRAGLPAIDSLMIRLTKVQDW